MDSSAIGIPLSEANTPKQAFLSCTCLSLEFCLTLQTQWGGNKPPGERQSKASLGFVGISILAKPSGSYPQGTSQ